MYVDVCHVRRTRIASLAVQREGQYRCAWRILRGTVQLRNHGYRDMRVLRRELYDDEDSARGHFVPRMDFPLRPCLRRFRRI